MDSDLTLLSDTLGNCISHGLDTDQKIVDRTYNSIIVHSPCSCKRLTAMETTYNI